MRYDVAQDVSLRAIRTIIAGDIGRILLWQIGTEVVDVHCKQIISHVDMQFALAPKLTKEIKVVLPQSNGRAGIRLASWVQYTQYAYPITWSTRTSTRSGGVWSPGLFLYL